MKIKLNTSSSKLTIEILQHLIAGPCELDMDSFIGAPMDSQDLSVSIGVIDMGGVDVRERCVTCIADDSSERLAIAQSGKHSADQPIQR